MRGGETLSGERIVRRGGSEGSRSGGALQRFAERLKAFAGECAPVVLGLAIAAVASWLPPF